MVRNRYLVWGLLFGCFACSPKAAAPPQATADAVAVESGKTRLSGSRVSLWTPKEMRRPSRLAYLRMDEPLVVLAITELTGRDAAATKLMLDGAKDGAKLSDEKPVTHGAASGFIGHGTSDETGLRRQILGLAAGPAV